MDNLAHDNSALNQIKLAREVYESGIISNELKYIQNLCGLITSEENYDFLKPEKRNEIIGALEKIVYSKIALKENQTKNKTKNQTENKDILESHSNQVKEIVHPKYLDAKLAKKIRESKNLSTLGLAKELGFTEQKQINNVRTYIDDLEKGNRSLNLSVERKTRFLGKYVPWILASGYLSQIENQSQIENSPKIVSVDDRFLKVRKDLGLNQYDFIRLFGYSSSKTIGRLIAFERGLKTPSDKYKKNTFDETYLHFINLKANLGLDLQVRPEIEERLNLVYGRLKSLNQDAMEKSPLPVQS